MEKIIDNKKTKILVTGANGFLGFNFILKLKELKQFEIYEHCYFSTDKDLKRFCKDCDYVFHFAGVINAKQDKIFKEGNVKLTKKLLSYLSSAKNKAPIIFTSSIWVDNYPNHIYSTTKLEAENLIKKYADSKNTKAYIYRLNNLYGKYADPFNGGVVMKFAYNVVHNNPLLINDENKEISLTYVDDLLEDFISLINNKKEAKDYYCSLPKGNTTTVGKLAKIMQSFGERKFQESSLKSDFERKLIVYINIFTTI